MGIGSILSARKIIILANGEGKRAAVEAMLSGKVDTKCPASFLALHKDVTLITDIQLSL
jgi:glucosamine-6-phosphate deaminase